jgi:predicted Zn-dependent protease
MQYSREAESEADDYSVSYLCPTTWDAAGSAGFFEKLLATGSGARVPEFLSTHPSPENRVQRIKDRKTTLGCMGADRNAALYTSFKNSLP